MVEINYRATERFSLSYAAFNTMRRDDQLCDIKFVIGDKKFAAHKIILASQCDYFKDMFTGDFKDSTILTIDDIEDESLISLELIIEFIYTSRLKINDSNVKDLLITSNFLSLDDVREKCLKFVKQIIDINNFMEFKDLCISHTICGLNDLIVKFVRKNFNHIAKSKVYLSLSFEFILELIESDDLYVNEEQVYESTVMWLKHDIEERSKYLPELIQAIRFSLLSIDYLNNTVQEEDLITSNAKCLKYVCKAYKEKYEPVENDALSPICKSKHRKYNNEIVQVYCWNRANGACNMEWISTGNEFKKKNLFSWISHDASIILNDGRIVSIKPSCMKQIWSIHIFDSKVKGWNHVGTLALKENKEETLFNLVELDECIYIMTDSGNFKSFNIVEKQLVDLERIYAKHFRYRGLTVSNGLIYLVSYDNVFQYNPKADKWLNISKSGYPEESPAICSLNGYLYAIGTKSMRFNILNNVWNDIADMNAVRCCAGAIATDELIYVFGGKNCDSYEIYDPNDDSWTSSTDKLSSKSHTFTNATVLTLEKNVNPDTLFQSYLDYFTKYFSFFNVNS